MLKRNSSSLVKLLLIVIASILFLLIMGGGVSANDEYWNGTSQKNLLIVGKTTQIWGQNTDPNGNTIKWRADVTKSDNIGSQIGEVTLYILDIVGDQTDIPIDLILPNKIRYELGATYVWQIKALNTDEIKGKYNVASIEPDYNGQNTAAPDDPSEAGEVIWRGSSVKKLNQAQGTISGKEGNIEWEITILTRDTVTSNRGTAKLKIKNPSSLSGNIVLPDVVKYRNWFAGYAYDIVEIEIGSFKGASNVTSIEIGKSVRSIPNTSEDFFEGCTKLREIKVRDGNANLSSVNGVLFNKNKTHVIKFPSGKGSSTYVLPTTVTEVENYAFSENSAIKNIDLSNVTKIGRYAFYKCSSLGSVKLSKSLTTLPLRVFAYCTSLKNIEWIGTAEKPALTTIESAAFYNCTKLNFDIPSNVTTIGSGAFQLCKRLVVVNLPTGLTSLGNRAFQGCISLSKVETPASLTKIPDEAFADCKRLAIIDMTLSTQLTTIGKNAFRGCYLLTEVTIPDSVTSLGSGCFYHCYNYDEENPQGLRKVTLPVNLTVIPESAFMDCGGLKEINLSSLTKLTDIRKDAFCGTGLTYVEIPENADTNKHVNIESFAFGGCDNLSTVILPSRVTFTVVSHNRLDAHGNEREVKNIFFSNTDYNKMENVVIYCTGDNIINENTNISPKPANIIYEINESNVTLNKFTNNSTDNKITRISLLDKIYSLNVNEINANAFKNETNLTRVIIPSTVTTIGAEAFSGCTNANVCLNKNINSGSFSVNSNTFTGAKKVYYGTEGVGTKLGSITNKELDNQINAIGTRDESMSITSDSSAYIIKFTGISDTQSGLYKYLVDNNLTDEQLLQKDWNEFEENQTSVEEHVNGNGTYYLYVMDGVGNIFKSSAIEVSGVDDQNPEIISALPDANDAFKYTITVRDDKELSKYVVSQAADVRSVREAWVDFAEDDIQEVIDNNKTYQQFVGTINIPTKGIWYLYVQDGAGNTTRITIDTTLATDNVAPTIVVTGTPTKNTNNEVIAEELNITLTDNTGVLKYAIDKSQEVTEETEWVDIDNGPKFEYQFTHLLEVVEAGDKYYIHAQDSFGNTKTEEFDTANDAPNGFTDHTAPRFVFPDIDSVDDNTLIVKVIDFSGIKAGAKLKYQFTTDKNIIPTTWNDAETVNYNEGAKEVQFIIDGSVMPEAGRYYLWVKADGIQDTANNTTLDTPQPGDAQYEVGGARPVIENNTILTDKLAAKNGDYITFTLKFTKPVTKSEVKNIEIISSFTGELAEGETISTIPEDGITKPDPQKDEWEVKVLAGSKDETIKLKVPKEAFMPRLDKDYESDEVKIDNTKPDITAIQPTIDKAVIKSGDIATITYTFDEVISIDTTKTVTVTGEGITNPEVQVSVSEDGKSLIIKASAGGDGQATVNIPAGLVKDAAGNESDAATYTGITVDNTKPGFTSSGPTEQAYINNNASSKFTVKLGEGVEINDISKLVVTKENSSDTVNATATIEKKKEDGTEWEVTVSNATGNGQIYVIMQEGLFKDKAGNLNETSTKANSAIINVDNTAPVIGTPTYELIAEGSVANKKARITVTTDQSENGDKYEYVVTTANDITKITEEWAEASSATITKEVAYNGEFYVYVRDKAGNVAKSSKITVEGIIDTTNPTILSISNPNPATIKKGSISEYRIVMSEKVEKETTVNPTLTGEGATGATVTVEKESDTSFIAKVTAGEANGSVTLTIPQGMFIDGAGNLSINTINKTGLIIDNTKPTVQVTFEPVGDGTKVKIKANEQLDELEGWDISDDGKELSKIAKEDIDTVTVTDKAGNEKIIHIDLVFAKSDSEIPLAPIDTVAVGMEKSLNIGDLRPETFTWTSSDPSKLTVTNGVMKGIAATEEDHPVTVAIKSILDENITKTCKVTVIATGINVTDVSLNETSGTLKVGQEKALEVTITPKEATNTNVSWSTSNDEVAIVSKSGLIKAVGVGTAVITVKTEDGGKTKTYTLTVVSADTPDEVLVSDVTLDKTSGILEIGKTLTLVATVLPTDAKNKVLQWTSSNTNVATVSADGVVTAIGEGTATITAKSTDGTNKTATFTITVIKAQPEEDATGFKASAGYEVKTVNDVKYLLGINPNTKISDVISNVMEGYTIVVQDKQGNEIAETNYNKKLIGTEMKIILTKDGNSITYIVVVKGDCTSDGLPTATDLMTAVKQYKKTGTKLTVANLLAIKISSEEEYTAADLMKEVKLYKQYQSIE